MKKTAIVTGGTKDQFPAMAVLALNIADICPNIADELVIYHDGIPLEEQKKMQAIFPTKFILYKSPFLDEKDFGGVVTNYFSLMVFCKYECWNLLHDYKTVIWTDYDIVITKDISEVSEKTNNYAKFVKAANIAKKLYPQIYEKKVISNEDIHKDGISCNLFYLDDSFPNYDEFYRQCIILTREIANALYLPEEAVISILFLKNAIKYECLDEIMYVSQPRLNNATEKTKILHAAGQPKFWSGLDNEQWNNYYNEWLMKYKGTPFCAKNKKRIIFKKIFKAFLPYGVIDLIRILKRNHQC